MSDQADNSAASLNATEAAQLAGGPLPDHVNPLPPVALPDKEIPQPAHVALTDRVTALEEKVFAAAPAATAAAESVMAVVAPGSSGSLGSRLEAIEAFIEAHKGTIETLTTLAANMATKGVPLSTAIETAAKQFLTELW